MHNEHSLSFDPRQPSAPSISDAMKPLSTLFFLLVLSPLSFYYISLKLSSSPHGIAYTQLEVCENPSQPGPFSPPQVYAPEGIRTEWFGGRSKGGMACMLVDVFTTLLFVSRIFSSPPQHQSSLFSSLPLQPMSSEPR